MNRRYFLATALTAGASRPAAVAASDKVTIAFMGVNGRGVYLEKIFCALPDVNVAYLCDVDQRVLGRALKIVEEAKRPRPTVISDIRRALDDKTVDAVVIATPLHWHAPGAILACEAGKDVYVEKPPSHNIREGRLMVEAARRHKRIVQVGLQSHSRPVTQRFVDYVQSGKLGKALMAKVWNVQMRRNIGRRADEPPPPEVDYDIWTGPVPMLPFNRNHFHGTVNWHWHYGTGDIGNDGIHWLDIARWALGLGYPAEVSGMGRKLYFDDDQQTPDTMDVAFNYPDRVISYEQRLWNSYRLEGSENSVAVYGTNGYAVIGRWNDGHYAFKVFDENGQLIHFDQEPRPDDHHHHVDFLECIRSRKMPRGDVELGHVSAVLCHLGNIVSRTGRNLRFDGKTESILNDAEANQYAARRYREHWSTPKGA
jgi:predicted dehydrogenase